MTTIPDDWKAPDRTPLDFIVVGTGAGGAPLAARLAERGYTVLVVEMGPETPPKLSDVNVEPTEVPLLHIESTEDERLSLRFFVKHFDDDPDGSLDPKVHLPNNTRRDERGIFYPRAQGVGGCTIHNAMITVCGLSEDWDEIAEATEDESWRGERMRAYFQRVEQCHYARPTLWARLKGWLGFGTGWENGRHGFGGWLDTTMPDLRLLKRDRQLLKVVLAAALASIRAGVDRFGDLARAAFSGRALPSLDPNHWETMRQKGVGVSRIPCAITPQGERSSPRERLLSLKHSGSPAGERLHLLTGACVTELVLADDPVSPGAGERDARVCATGIRYLPREHVYEADPKAKVLEDDDWREQIITLHCRREVILSGGTFNTPQLLLLSGIGPADHLREHGIKPRVNLAGVGRNLQDRYEVPVIATITDRFRSLDGITLSSACGGDAELRRWIATPGQAAYRRGFYATNGGLVGIFLRSGQEDTGPDLIVLALAANFPGYSVGYSRPEALNPTCPKDPPSYHRKLTWLILKARTRHHDGYVRLQSGHPFQRPEINFCSFPRASDASLEPTDGQFPASADQDLEALCQGVGFVRSILEIGRDNGTIQSYSLPGFECFNNNHRKWIKHVAWGHHACGTCRIGAEDDELAVLDSRFRVRGVQGLRVVDASIFPRIPGFFIAANIYMIAEKAADVITEDHPLSPKQLPAGAAEALKRDPVLPSSAVFEARRLYPADMEAVEAELIASRRRRAGL
ncbi:MAG TPA: GMC family oxidoreductase [Gemmataceae bacterium]|jgi:choline dehydrogenase